MVMSQSELLFSFALLVILQRGGAKGGLDDYVQVEVCSLWFKYALIT